MSGTGDSSDTPAKPSPGVSFRKGSRAAAAGSGGESRPAVSFVKNSEPAPSSTPSQQPLAPVWDAGSARPALPPIDDPPRVTPQQTAAQPAAMPPQLPPEFRIDGGSQLEPASTGQPSIAARRGLWWGIAAVLTLVLVVILVAGHSGGSRPPADVGNPATPAAAQQQPTEITSAAPDLSQAQSPTTPSTPTPTPKPKPVSPMVTYQVRAQVGPQPGDCVADSFGQVQDFLAGEQPCSLSRSLYSGRVGGRPVAISVATLSLGNTADNQALVGLSTRNLTGDVRTLLSDGAGYSGSPSSWTDDPTFLAVVTSQDEVEILEVMWADGGPTHEKNPSLARMLGAIAPYLAGQ